MLPHEHKELLKKFLDRILDDDYGIPDAAMQPLHKMLENFLSFDERIEILQRMKFQDGRWFFRKDS